VLGVGCRGQEVGLSRPTQEYGIVSNAAGKDSRFTWTTVLACEPFGWVAGLSSGIKLVVSVLVRVATQNAVERVWHIAKSRPDSGLDFQDKILENN